MTKRMLTAVLTAALTLSLTACGGGEQQEMGETCTVYTMDTVMNLTAYGENASAALDAAEETLRTLDAKLDRHDKASAVSALNRDGTVEDAELAQLTDIAQTIGTLSGGAFDPTVAPVMDAWDFTGDAPRVPSDEELYALLAHVGLEKLSVDGNTVALSDGAQLDLGGIAKGYIADQVAALVRGRCSGAMLNFGGNVYAVGTKPDGSAYRVGVQDPDEPNSSIPTGLMSVTNSSSPIGVVSVIDRSVVTSGIYERGFTIDGVRYHHILSPWTGLPSDSDLASATIIAESSMDADALATACIVLGSEKALQLTQENGYPALMILRDGTVMMNDLMKQWGYTSLR